jgi:hypothetical protein
LLTRVPFALPLCHDTIYIDSQTANMVAPLTTAQQIAELHQLVNRLRTADQSCRVFGSDRHRHRFGPALPSARAKAFESAHSINLPPDYRCFLTTIGNGGAGPYYGLAPLCAQV